MNKVDEQDISDEPEIKELTSLLRRLEKVKSASPTFSETGASFDPETPTETVEEEAATAEDEAQAAVASKVADEPAQHVASAATFLHAHAHQESSTASLEQEIAALSKLRESLSPPAPVKSTSGVGLTVLLVSLIAFVSMSATLLVVSRLGQTDPVAVAGGGEALLPAAATGIDAAAMPDRLPEFPTAVPAPRLVDSVAGTEPASAAAPDAAAGKAGGNVAAGAVAASDQAGSSQKPVEGAAASAATVAAAATGGNAEPAEPSTAPSAEVDSNATQVAAADATQAEPEPKDPVLTPSKTMELPLFVPDRWVVPPRATRQLPFVLAAHKTNDYRVIIVGLEEGARVANAINIDAGIWMLNGENLADARIERGDNPPPERQLVVELRKAKGGLIGRRRVVLLTSLSARN